MNVNLQVIKIHDKKIIVLIAKEYKSNLILGYSKFFYLHQSVGLFLDCLHV